MKNIKQSDKLILIDHKLYLRLSTYSFINLMISCFFNIGYIDHIPNSSNE